ncbi:uncharacterized protein BDR25DRAFT_350708 [Lindgomyces ingoldianus]|uniref:Uncharacterized protein n=1 Tax=Lindgomyces ingoldianus TaxID=673940 RepID=A0ACB6R7T4_9PLEO|nr:uncharacterized protein BDR25DRAFT_350708 [Lindgomyces ingoldianus]KAF2475319.1 hypothetical protein BDR25DRAFT_350708 [Lindgomyces ingoldianus]
MAEFWILIFYRTFKGIVIPNYAPRNKALTWYHSDMLSQIHRIHPLMLSSFITTNGLKFIFLLHSLSKCLPSFTYAYVRLRIQNSSIDSYKVSTTGQKQVRLCLRFEELISYWYAYLEYVDLIANPAKRVAESFHVRVIRIEIDIINARGILLQTWLRRVMIYSVSRLRGKLRLKVATVNLREISFQQDYRFKFKLCWFAKRENSPLRLSDLEDGENTFIAGHIELAGDEESVVSDLGMEGIRVGKSKHELEPKMKSIDMIHEKKRSLSETEQGHDALSRYSHLPEHQINAAACQQIHSPPL